MTLYEALQDIGKGRIIDNGCDYVMISLAKGRYTIHNGGKVFSITLTGSQGENARTLEREYNSFCWGSRLDHNRINKIEYKKA